MSARKQGFAMIKALLLENGNVIDGQVLRVMFSHKISMVSLNKELRGIK